jgi:hypothetical protein
VIYVFLRQVKCGCPPARSDRPHAPLFLLPPTSSATSSSMPSAYVAGQDVQDFQDDYARQQCEQRPASADLHARFSTSDLSDSTSEYNHSLFSANRGEPPSPTSAHYLASHGHIPPISIADRERLNDPSCSSLDFNDASDVSPPTSLCDDSDQLSISSLGPKMRFHSRAPWEMEDTPHENETTHELTRTFTNKTMAKLFNFGPSSPRVSNFSRPSGESIHPEIVHKKSMDSSAGNGLYSRGTA